MTTDPTRRNAFLASLSFPCSQPLFALVIALSASPASLAQTSETPTDPPADSQTFKLDEIPNQEIRLEPALWAPSLSGDIQLPGSPRERDVQSFNIDEPAAAPFGELHSSAYAFTFSFSGFGFKTDDTVVAVKDFSFGRLNPTAGQQVHARLSLNSFQAMASRRIWRREFARKGADRGVTMQLDLGAGLRGYDLDISASVIGGALSTDSNTFIEPIVGVTLTTEILDDFSFDLGMNVGYSGLGSASSQSFDLVLGFRWQMNRTVGLQIGYRLLFVDLIDNEGDPNEFQFRGSLAGIYGGLVFRF